MSTRLAILGMLHEGPQHGYAIMRRIEAQMGDWTAIALGSLYHALRKLEQDGLIQKTRIVQQGERTVSTYALTPAGREEFLYLLEDIWRFAPGMYFEFDIALYFMGSLPLAARLDALLVRLDDLEQEMAYLRKQRPVDPQQGPPSLAQAIFDHSLRHYAAEIGWVRKLLNNMRAGVYEQGE